MNPDETIPDSKPSSDWEEKVEAGTCVCVCVCVRVRLRNLDDSAVDSHNTPGTQKPADSSANDSGTTGNTY